jgi:hypothetical protein
MSGSKRSDAMVAVQIRRHRPGEPMPTADDGELVISDGDSVYISRSREAIEQTIAEDRAMRGREERRRALWGDGGRDSMTRLAMMFPSLRRAPGVAPWDVTALLRWACDVDDDSARHAAKFVLSVWNGCEWEAEARREGFISEEDRFGPFSVAEAVSVWDEEHVQAFMAWVRDPFWP